MWGRFGGDRPQPMAQLLKTWTPAVASCLILQAGLIGMGVVVDRWFNPHRPCCSQHLVL